ncbi:hypothetical protein DAEQUDRAFT_769205 [Daedalea quercina L-15889]|uniref:Uncharacterized protein n=1 Tax=Daedalea quercina L-15889 TaxID=1314783 RepID=A0A165LZR8_9APHY|nr:hypothetical protein DAEQUDRAFT_769205 [Daedalea quercina L-15889]
MQDYKPSYAMVLKYGKAWLPSPSSGVIPRACHNERIGTDGLHSGRQSAVCSTRVQRRERAVTTHQVTSTKDHIAGTRVPVHSPPRRSGIGCEVDIRRSNDTNGFIDEGCVHLDTQAVALPPSSSLVPGRPSVWAVREDDEDLLCKLSSALSSTELRDSMLFRNWRCTSQSEEDALLRNAVDQALEEMAQDAIMQDYAVKDDTSSGSTPVSYSMPRTPLDSLAYVAPQQPLTLCQPRLWRWLGLTASHVEPDFPAGIETGFRCSLPPLRKYQSLQSSDQEPLSMPQRSTAAKKAD